MEQLNNKVISSSDETLFQAQVSGLYGFDNSAEKWRRLTCDADGKLNIEATLELDTSGLAKEAKQDTIINATLRDINNTGAIGDGSSQATALSLGYDRSNGQGRAILVDSGGKVEVNASMNAGHGLATEAKQDDIINATNRAINNTGSIGDGSTNATSVALGYDRSGGKGRAVLVDSDGRLEVSCIGNTEGDGSGTYHHLHLDANGNVNSQIINTVNIAPANSVNSGITNDPANSVAVGLRGRTTITDSTTEKFLLTDSDGHLQVDVLSGGGGGTQYNMGDAIGATPTGTLALGRDGSGNAQAIQVSASGNQFVELADFTKGQTTMANSFPVNIASDQSRLDVQTNRDEVTITQSAVAVANPNTFNSTSVDMRGYTVVSFIGTTTNSTDMMSVQYSIDDTTFFDGSDNVIINTNGHFNVTISATGARYVRLSQSTVDLGGGMTITCISSKK